MAPSTPTAVSAASARMSSSELTPPEAMTGRAAESGTSDPAEVDLLKAPDAHATTAVPMSGLIPAFDMSVRARTSVTERTTDRVRPAQPSSWPCACEFRGGGTYDLRSGGLPDC